MFFFYILAIIFAPNSHSFVFLSFLQPFGRAVSRLLESFAADEGFHMDGSSFSEEDEDHSPSHKKSPKCKKRSNAIVLCQSIKQKIVFGNV